MADQDVESGENKAPDGDPGADSALLQASRPALDLDKPTKEMTQRELVAKMSRKAGHAAPGYGYINKELFNSIHAFLTGSFIEKPDAIHDHEGKSLADYRIDVAFQAGLNEYPQRPPNARRYTADEMRALVEEMDDRGDQRDWLQPES